MMESVFTWQVAISRIEQRPPVNWVTRSLKDSGATRLTEFVCLPPITKPQKESSHEEKH